MVKKIKLFMWGYQPHFQLSVKVTAERLFGKLVKGLNPRVFLVGVWFDTDTLPRTYPVCLEPEDECGYDPEIFNGIHEKAKELEKNDPENKIFHSHPIAQENHERRIKLNSIRKAILSILSPFDKELDLVSFASSPVNVEGYMVCTILQFNKQTFEKVYALKRDKIHERYTVSTSLLDATVAEYLYACAKALQEPDPGSGLGVIGREEDEIIRSAGKRLMATPAWAADGFRPDLFENFNMISAQKYEGTEGTGKIVIASRDHPSIRKVVTLAKSVQLSNYRAVRKLLEMTSENLFLLADSDVVYGLGQVEVYNPKDEDLFVVHFTKHYTWQLSHDENIMMHVAYRQPGIIREKMNREKFISDVKRIFNEMSGVVLERLWNVIEVASEQKHGTMVVISTGAKEEADRLQYQSTSIEPVEITSEIMRMVTSIDGAVLIGPNGICYAIGVILDGLASKKGDPARGARYNSAVRYIESQKYQCLIVVVSEDGYINYIPDLMPQIKRSDIDMVLAELRRINESNEEVNIKYFNKLMGWLSRKRFYVLQDDCEEINRLRDEIQQKMDTNIWVQYTDFYPHPEMNESYYLEEKTD